MIEKKYNSIFDFYRLFFRLFWICKVGCLNCSFLARNWIILNDDWIINSWLFQRIIDFCGFCEFFWRFYSKWWLSEWCELSTCISEGCIGNHGFLCNLQKCWWNFTQFIQSPISEEFLFLILSASHSLSFSFSPHLILYFLNYLSFTLSLSSSFSLLLNSLFFNSLSFSFSLQAPEPT